MKLDFEMLRDTIGVVGKASAILILKGHVEEMGELFEDGLKKFDHEKYTEKLKEISIVVDDLNRIEELEQEIMEDN